MAKLNNEPLNLLEALTKDYESYQNHPQFVAWLGNRGITQETARKFRLGYVPQNHDSEPRYLDRISIPYLRPAGVVEIKYRLVGDDERPKYVNRPGAETKLFNTDAAFTAADSIIITEGELDAIILDQIGLPAIGVPGVNNFKPHFDRIFEDFDRVLVYADGDKPGHDFADELQSRLGATPVHMPDGMDVNDVYLNGGREFLEEKFYGEAGEG